jgi:hypothetical protein
MSDDFRFVLDAECCLASSRECMISIWRGAPDARLVIAHYSLARQLIMDYRRTAMMIIIERDAPMPDSHSRDLIEKFYAYLARELVFVAQVVEGDGFGQSAARAVMSTINLLGRRPYPTKIFASTKQSNPWAAGLLGAGDSEARKVGLRLDQALERARAQHTFRRPPSHFSRRPISLAPPRSS